ncbi:2'-5' RNA ligase family protein [Streptomyces sp. NPDC058289]|uniref:2'-5' RNA ligase family protein n=1 Tax=Streptomyces sp. NPDC058289 TaxID=3346425 RepID=UPI0036ED1720
MGTVTLGVSIAVPEPYGSSLQELRAGFGDAAAHGIPTHVTLVPPTEVDADRLPEIRVHLAEVAAAGRPFVMRLAGTGTFRPLSPVVFVQVVEGGSVCTRLQGQVRDPEGPLSRELSFPYHPHVTVAHGISEEAMDLAFSTLADYAAEWVCSGIALYEQGSDGVWRKLREYPFGNGASGGASAVPAQLGSTTDNSAAAAAGEATVRRS